MLLNKNRRKNVKRLLSLFLVSLLVATILVGCADQNHAAQSDQTSVETQGVQNGTVVEALQGGSLTDAQRITSILGDRVLAPLPDASQGVTVRLGYFNCDHMAAAPIAYYSGIFDTLGLNVSITGHGGVPEAMAAGHMDMGYVDHRLVFAARRAGSPLIVVAENHIGGSEYLVVSHDIREPQDLIGRRISIHADPNNFLNWIEWTYLMGIPSDVSLYENFVMSQTDSYFAFAAGELDAFISCDPWASMAIYEGTGWIMHRSNTDRPSGHGTCCKLVMRDGFGEVHPELVARMILAHTLAIQFMYLYPHRSAEIFSEDFLVPMEVSLMTMWRKLNYEGRTLSWDLNIEYFQNQVDTLRYFDIRHDINDAYVPNYVDLTLFEMSDADDFDAFIRERVDPIFPLGMTFEEWRAAALIADGLY